MSGRARSVFAAVGVLLALAGGCSAVSGLGGLRFDESGGSSAGGPGAGGSSADGGGPECQHASDCNPRDCIDVSCRDGRCLVAPSASGEGCSAGVCDGHGSCVECVSPSDCPAPDACQTAVCASRSCSTENAPPETACKSDGGQVCDGGGNCVACVSDPDCGPDGICSADRLCTDLCNDGLKNHDEIGVDCGGSCPPCGDGTPCTQPSECASGRCTDGFCCGQSCDFTCAACNVAGHEGQCRPVAAGTQDPGFCDMVAGGCGAVSCACNGNQSCRRAAGQPCQSDSQCASGACNLINCL